MKITPQGGRPSAVFRLEAADPFQDLQDTLKAMDRVHGFPTKSLARQVRIIHDPTLLLEEQGKFRNASDYWVEIALNPRTPPIVAPSVLTHEIGHFLDAMFWGFRGGYASELSESLAAWRRIVADTESIQELHAILNIKGTSNRSVSDEFRTKMVQYLLQDHEIFARCYTQYVTLRSAEPKLRKWLDHHLGNQPRDPFPTQWREDDFALVADEMDRIFEVLGWQKR